MNESPKRPGAPAAGRRITERAASWYLDYRDGLDDNQRARFLTWLEQSPAHVAEYLAIAAMHHDLKATIAVDTMRAEQPEVLTATRCTIRPLHHAARKSTTAGQLHAAAPTIRRRPKRWKALARVASMLFVGVGLSYWIFTPRTDVYTSLTEIGPELTLADGSLMRLDKNSTVAVSFNARQRIIEVRRGGALIDVGKDPSRPLQVQLGTVVLRDVGTVFEAHRQSDGATVTVLSGQVDVLAPARTWHGAWLHLLRPHAEAAPVVVKLARGEQASVNDDGAVTALTAHANLAEVTAWLPPELYFQRRTVAEVARRFNAYSSRPLAIEDPTLASVRISGRFHGNDVNAFIAYLASLPGVRIQRDDEVTRIGRSVVHGQRKGRRL